MEIVRRGDPKYPQARIISNARFDYEPAAIYFCDTPADVPMAIFAGPGNLRMRSGGHQHEGMCSGNEVIILDVSRLNHIKIEGNLARLGPGAKLKDIYDAVGEAHLLFPGGGCGDVRVGGLVQGGGWGPYSRRLGLTCDSLESFDIVPGSGIPIQNVSATNHPELFWAVSGGGGGNFGIVTEFRFRLQRQETAISQFTITWKDRAFVRAVIDDWRAHFPKAADLRLTSFCRLGTGEDAPALIGGAFLGDRITCARVLKEQLPNTFSHGELTFPAEGTGRKVAEHPDYQPGALGDTPNLGDTCAGNPFPHKISSCFPSGVFGDTAVDVILAMLARTGAIDKARRYLSLHSLGGAVDDLSREKTSCFPYRKKPFMLQYQAWWWDMSNPDTNKACMDWIAEFRQAMHTPGFTEGSFINFPDYDLVGLWSGGQAEDRRKALLRYYYAGNLEKLIGIKHQYDRGNFFDFPMGIPPV